MGSIHNALENPDESLNHYNLARKVLETLPTEQTAPPDIADWTAVLDLKLAQHHLRTKNHKQAQYAPLPSRILIPTNDPLAPSSNKPSTTSKPNKKHPPRKPTSPGRCTGSLSSTKPRAAGR